VKALPIALVTGLLAAAPALAAPKTIPISDSLAANADKLKVKMGTQWFGRVAKWRIGDYEVVASKLGTTHIETGSNFWKTKSDSASSTRFSFVMSATPADSVTVTAEHHFRTRSQHEFKLNKTVGLGSDALIGEADVFAAMITLNADTTVKWTLLKASTINATGDSVFEAHLTSAERKIVIAPVVVDPQKGKRGRPSFFAQLGSQIIPPAMGYEFLEDGRSVCAVQTSGGPYKETGRMVWMHRALDSRDKLVLAAAITAILQIESLEDTENAAPERPER
jgi:hypothetical protein